MAADLALALAQEAVVTHPVGGLVSQPAATLGAVVVGTGGTHLQGEVFVPVYALRAVGHIEAVLDAGAGVLLLHLPGQLVGANVEAAPALRVADETGNGHWAFQHARQLFAFLDVFPVTGSGATNLFVFVELVVFGQLLVGERLNLALDVVVLGAALACFVAVGTEHPAVGVGDQVTVLVVEVNVIDLLEGTTGEAGLMLNQVFQIRFGVDHVVAQNRLVPVPVGAGPHGVNAGQAATVAGDDAAGAEQEAGQRDDGAVLGVLGVFGVAPQRVVVADAVSVVTDAVTGRFIVPRLNGIGDLDADALAEVGQAFLGDLGKLVGRHNSVLLKINCRPQPLWLLHGREGPCGEPSRPGFWAVHSQIRSHGGIRGAPGAPA